ncbi:MAG: dimethyl sulfoxide reductase anchor subunit [Nitrospirota bacterium]|jgi:DMSO reductase anchor subunit
MHPATSVILFTTFMGVGQGLFLALYTAQLYGAMGILTWQASPTFCALGSLLAVVLLLAGTGASFRHLGRPERSWRSAAMWRTSWLSREVIMLPVTIGLIVVYGALHGLGWDVTLFTVEGFIPVDITLVVGLLAAIAVFGLFLSTAMIYASMPFLQEWHSPLTVFNFVFLGSASGFTLATAVASGLENGGEAFFTNWAVILTSAAFVTRGSSLILNGRRRRKSTLESAIGVRHPQIRQITQGAMGGSFNTREFFHHKTPTRVLATRWAFLLLTFPLPIALLITGEARDAASPAVAAFVVQYLGLLAERWSFFADARHPQNLYYQAIA